MNNSKNNLLRSVLVTGQINVETHDKIKKEIFTECHMDMSLHKDRALWSSWINCKSTPNRFCQVAINSVLTRHQLNPIYD